MSQPRPPTDTHGDAPGGPDERVLDAFWKKALAESPTPPADAARLQRARDTIFAAAQASADATASATQAASPSAASAQPTLWHRLRHRWTGASADARHRDGHTWATGFASITLASLVLVMWYGQLPEPAFDTPMQAHSPAENAEGLAPLQAPAIGMAAPAALEGRGRALPPPAAPGEAGTAVAHGGSNVSLYGAADVIAPAGPTLERPALAPRSAPPSPGAQAPPLARQAPSLEAQPQPQAAARAQAEPRPDASQRMAAVAVPAATAPPADARQEKPSAPLPPTAAPPPIAVAPSAASLAQAQATQALIASPSERMQQSLHDAAVLQWHHRGQTHARAAPDAHAAIATLADLLAQAQPLPDATQEQSGATVLRDQGDEAAVIEWVGAGRIQLRAELTRTQVVWRPANQSEAWVTGITPATYNRVLQSLNEAADPLEQPPPAHRPDR